MSIADAAKYMRKSERFVTMCVEQFKASETVDDFSACGKQRKTIYFLMQKKSAVYVATKAI